MKCRASWGKNRCVQHLIYATVTLSLFIILWNLYLGHFLRKGHFYKYIMPLLKNGSASDSNYLRETQETADVGDWSKKQATGGTWRGEVDSQRFGPESSSGLSLEGRQMATTDGAQVFSTTPPSSSPSRSLNSPPRRNMSCSAWYSRNTTSIMPDFIRNTNLFLTFEGDWWHERNYVSYALPYGIKGNEAILRQLLLRTNSNMLDEIDRLVCKRCIVVGNGNALRNSLLGGAIDKYDIVIRLNNAPVKGYEQDVGNKTTLRFFYPESAIHDFTAENNPNTLFVLVPFKTVDVLWMKALIYKEAPVVHGFWKNPALIKEIDPSKVRLLNPFYLHQAVTKLLQQPNNVNKVGAHPSTGFLAITVALNYCDEVHVAGFGYPLNQKDGLIHYFDQLKMALMLKSVHNVTHEHLHLKKLQNAGIIKYLI